MIVGILTCLADTCGTEAFDKFVIKRLDFYGCICGVRERERGFGEIQIAGNILFIEQAVMVIRTDIPPIVARLQYSVGFRLAPELRYPVAMVIDATFDRQIIAVTNTDDTALGIVCRNKT